MTFLVSHHGLSRTIYSTTSFCNEHSVKSFSPLFDEDRWSSDEYQKGGMLSGERQTCTLEKLFLKSVRTGRGDPREPCWIYGHSAGGQYVSRVAAYAPPPRVTRYIVANPSTWVWPDDRDAPYGFGLLYAAGAERDRGLAAYLQLPLTVFIGENDNDPNDSTLDTSREAMAQGVHRRERGENVFAAAQAAATALKVPLNWTLVIAPKTGHSGSGMLNAVNRNLAFGLSP